MSIEEREGRKRRVDNANTLLTAGIFLSLGVLLLIGLWMISKTAQQYQGIAQGVFGSTIVLAFILFLNDLRTKLQQREVSDAVDTSVKVAAKVEEVKQTSQATKELVNGGRERELAALVKEHEAALAAVRDEHQRERHTLKGQNGVLYAANAQLEGENTTLRETKASLEAQVRDLTDRLSRCAEKTGVPGPQGEKGDKGDPGTSNC